MRTVLTILLVVTSSLIIFSIPYVHIFIKIPLFVILLVLYNKKYDLLTSWFNEINIIKILMMIVPILMCIIVAVILILSASINKLRSDLHITVGNVEWNKIIEKSTELTAWVTQLYIWEAIFLIFMLILLFRFRNLAKQ
jgi:hypothetical protein